MFGTLFDMRGTVYGYGLVYGLTKLLGVDVMTAMTLVPVMLGGIYMVRTELEVLIERII